MFAAVLVPTDRALCDQPFLGMPISLRSAVTLAEAGARSIALWTDSAELPAWTEDPRLSVPVHRWEGEAGTYLVLRAEAVVAPQLLRELRPGDRLCDDTGRAVASCVTIEAGQSALAALADGAAYGFSADAQRYALALHDRESLRRASQLLFAALIKPTDGPVSRHLNRHVSRTLTRLVLPLGMTPNTMTVFVAVSGFFAAWLASSAAFTDQLLGAALYQVHSIIDGCDGELARLTKRFGKHGALIDSLVDDLVNFSFFVGLSIGVSRALDARWPILGASITGATYLLIIALQYGVVLRSTGRGDKTKFWDVASSGSLRASLFAFVHALLRRDVFVLLILAMVALELSHLLVAVFPFAAVGTLVSTVNRMRELRA